MIYADNLSGCLASRVLGKVRGKALVRADINVPVKEGKVSSSNLRFKEFARSIEEYSRNGIIPIIISHQGRAGDPDYLESMQQHAEVLGQIARSVRVKYCDSLGGRVLEDYVAGLVDGDALVLKNIRSSVDEKRKYESISEMSKSGLIASLSKVADFYINDAPATMHRQDASLMGFIPVMPSYIGLQMERELRILEEIYGHLKSGKRSAIIFGGKKWEKFDYIYEIAKNENVRILCGGVPGQSIAYVGNRGSFDRKNAEYIEGTGSLDTASKLASEFGDRIFAPDDFVLEGGRCATISELRESGRTIADIGDATIGRFFGAIDTSEMIIYAGPVGMYEKGYNQTLRLITRFMGEKALNYTFGGNSADSMDDIGLDRAYEALGGKRITSGGSALAFIAGHELSVLKAFLEQAR